MDDTPGRPLLQDTTQARAHESRSYPWEAVFEGTYTQLCSISLRDAELLIFFLFIVYIALDHLSAASRARRTLYYSNKVSTYLSTDELLS